jgi:uncharacterized protein YjdB
VPPYRAVLLALAVFAGCSGPVETAPEPEPPAPPILVVEVSPADRILQAGETLVMSARVIYPQDWGQSTVTWSVSDDKVATVSSEGVVLAIRAGTIGVRATLRNNKGNVAQGVATLHVQ